MPCLDENILLELVQGRLATEEYARVHAHLDSCAHCRHLSALVARASAGSASTAGDAFPPAESAGTVEPARSRGTFGRYFILGTLGHGGMGEVVLAYDPKLDRNVALKRLRPRVASLPPQARARLLREAQAMARLSHPNVLTVHDAGELDGEVFISMEYVRGRTLRRWLAEPRDWREALAMFRAAGEGLAAAHRAGLIHRDFKPDNVLVGEDGRPRVMDFGLARTQALSDGATEPGSDGAPSRGERGEQSTETGGLPGTSGYIAPEGLRGELGPLSDQFSFFVSLYEALYGERPFQGAALMDQLRAAERGEVRPARSERSVPKRVRRLLLTGLAADPNRRFDSMEEALAALSRVALHRGRRWAIGAATALALAAIVAGAIWARGQPKRQCRGSERFLKGTWDEAKRQQVRASFTATGVPQAELTFQSTALALDQWAQAFVQLRTEACWATKVFGEQSVETMNVKMQCLDRRWMDFDALVRQLSTPDAALVSHAVEAAQSLPALFECANPGSLRDPAASMDDAKRKRIDELRRALAEAKAKELLKSEPALRLAQEVERESKALGLDRLRAEALILIGRLLDGSGLYASAEESFHSALEISQAQGQDARAADAMIGLVTIVGARHQRFAEAHRWEKLARATLERAGLLGQEQEANLWNNAGNAAVFERSLDVAIASYSKALAIRERLNGPEHLRVARILNNLAYACANANRLEKGREYAMRALKIRERLLGPDHEEVTESLVVLGKIGRQAGQVRESRAFVERALAIAERTLPPDHPTLAEYQLSLGVALTDEADYAGAQEAFERALAILQARLGPNHARLASPLLNLTWLAQVRKDHRRVIELSAQVIQRFPTTHGADATAYQAEAHRALGNVEEAYRLFEQALRMLSIHPERRDALVSVLQGLAECELARGRRAEALEHLERALSEGERANLPPQDFADVRFILARALPATQADRARALALEARRGFAAAKRAATQLGAVDRFLAGVAPASR